MNKILIISFLSALICQDISSQTSMAYDAATTEYNNAMQLYEAGMYGSARTAFGNFIAKWGDSQSVLTEESKYFQAVSAKNLRNADAVALMKDFADRCATSVHRHEIFYHLGDYYLIDGKINNALTWFTKANADLVGNDLRSDLIFKTGYCYFMRGKHTRALAQFDQLRGNTGKYASAVKYYRAHVDYEKGNLDEAVKVFLELEKDEGFSSVAPYYIAHIFYLQGHYPEAIRYAEPLAQGDNKKAVDMVRIVADSRFMIGEYNKAIESYNDLIHRTKKVSRADYYHLGMCKYYVGEYDDAAQNLSKVTNERDELTQNAYYHLANCYIKLDDKKRARTAFDAASKYEFDKAIREDAHFNKLKLAYELSFSPFDEIITQFVEFIDTYPNSDKVDEAYDYIGKAFVTTKNYKKALATMEKIQHKNLNVYTALQRLSFYRGLELYTDTKFADAIEFFDYSLKYGDYDAKLKARANYWKAESLYRMGKISEAEKLYSSFIKQMSASELDEFTTCHYNLGYTKFNQKKYDEAFNWFLKYVSLNVDNKRFKSDAYNRLGDCMYVQRNFKPAVEYYDKAIATSSEVGDYSMLQKGICLGLQKDNRAKITQLQSLIEKYPKSPYCDNAYYEIARAYVALDQLKDAIYNFKVVKERYPKGSLAPKAMLQLGLLYYNNGEYDNSLAFYKRVVNEYPATPDAIDALAGLKNVYMERGDFDGFMAYTSTLGSFAKVELHERDSLMFTSAERLYLKGDFDQAQSAFERYMSAFADGRFATGACFYLGECNYMKDNIDKAIEMYTYVAEKPRSIYTEDALLRGGELLFKTEKYSAAAEMFTRLEQEAEASANKTEAIIGQMRCAQRLGDSDLCIQGADKVIQMPEATPEILREAKYLKAKSLIQSQRAVEATPLLRELAENTKSVEGAEAKYLLAQMYFDNNDLAKAEKEVFNYAENGTPHQYWLARSFILLADVYHAQGDDFQAQQYLETLRESYTGTDDISSMIDKRFSQWKLNNAANAE
ncbi:MAG: tetratricopeptide repeat protein [Bacteroidales bacterium]|nr:tetratricopeptide repeat protein [Bacteroidales bacterium]